VSRNLTSQDRIKDRARHSTPDVRHLDALAGGRQFWRSAPA
jgi:hypothetical protein